MYIFQSFQWNYSTFLLIDAPSFIAQGMDDTENEGDTANFYCHATGEPVPTVSWYFNDVPVDVTNTVKYDVVLTMFSTSILSILRINNVQSSDVGTYTCNATNVVSSDTTCGVLTVNGEQTCYMHILYLQRCVVCNSE